MEKKGDDKKLNKKGLQKIAAVASIVLLIGGVWLAKNREMVFKRMEWQGEDR